MSRAMRLGVIDDEPDIVALLDIAARMDSRVDLVVVGTTLADGLTAIAEADLDVVLVDRWLPDGDTLDHVDALRTAAGTARLVMLSAQVPLHYQRPALDAGLDGYLDKTVLADISQTPLSTLLGQVSLVGAV